ncbi:MAG: T9SS type A sorting domain-containing protein [Candidatus Cloacimonetes bacterium]|nr:T9SS type A sorting domain-containing protein [Candidatus Cloacimonadota bacterium]MCF7815031.1 T9SS type A sorting domain-containing protein [Candidatus Cloacimonadota bacterium]MCF7869256.1 T9SS type A sorting domain-containing protein [Candidatus Cloacimonadota bacterium]MCF7884690.1 T9SS type A sorting domain-containing protein [Candidatus Cloacimonadota bacterium]
MRTISFFVILFLLGTLFSIQQQIITRPEIGMQVISENTSNINNSIDPAVCDSRDDRVELNWQTSDPSAIAGEVSVSSATMNSLVQWHLNAERLSLYHDSSVPVWEHVVGDLDFGYPIDQLEDGSILAAGDGTAIKIFDPSSSNPTWQHSIGFTIGDLELSPAGDKIYISYYDAVQDRGNVECYDIGDTNPVWNAGFEGGAQTLGISGDGSTLIFTQYGGGNSNMWVLDSGDGSVIFQGPEYNQNPPAICHDASIIVNGDYSGYVHVYEYNDDLQTYEEAWYFHVDGGGTSDWIGGMAISADGSTIAVGTLTFVTGGYNGQIYIFNNYSPTPIWVYENVGDYVIDVDLTDDGSLLAVASYGPMDNSTSDFFLFRRESNIPVFEFDTPGSLFSVDISPDGTICTTGGKAVHARVMGSGGVLYNVDSDLGGGFITGVVNLQGSDDNSGVKVEIPELTDYYTFTDYDGNFSLNNIPPDSYSVDYTKVGYVANSSLNVIVNEGETTDLGEIMMQPFGSPPLNLSATQASDIFVELNWQAPATGTVEGYNIYRKRYEMDPYSETPYASVGEDELVFIDNEALPQIQYYYVVTAELAGGFQSPYSNEVQGWISTGFIANEIEVYEGSTPTIDGMISAGEWDDAFMMDTSDFWGSYDNTIQPIGSVIGYFKTNATITELYVAYINYNDTVLEDHDEVALYIDDNNDGVFAPEIQANEGNYWAAYYAAGNELKFRPIYDTGGVGTVFYLPDPQLEVSADEGYLVYEFMIPIGTEAWEINPSDDNQSSLAIFVLDDNTPDPHGFDGWWPMENINLFAPDGFGTITYGADLQTPPAPENLGFIDNADDTVTLFWDQPAMNDFDHFNIYLALDGTNFDLIGETVGINYLYEISNFQALHSFYVTTVNQSGLESDASNIVEFLPVSSGDTPILQTKLNGNYPNPFNPTTTINYSVAQTSSFVTLEIFNIKGQRVKQLVNEQLAAGQHSVVWNGKDDNGKQVSTGIYFYKMKSGNYHKSRKMLLLK